METITLRRGESHLIQLKGLGSAGYEWMLESFDSTVIAVERIPHSRDEVKAPIVGSLDERFKLTAVGPGQTLVHFAQRRRFQPGAMPHASCEVRVVVIA
jgi:predicted secreted protein